METARAYSYLGGMIRLARPSDLAELDALFARAYPALLKPDYPPSVLVTALPLISRAQPALLASGTFRVVEEDGRIVAAGGWTRAAPPGLRTRPGAGSVRHVVTDPDCLRRGHAAAILRASMDEARAAGLTAMAAMSTRTAVPFYAAMGFEPLGEVEVTLREGIAFPAVAMQRRL